MPRDKAAWIEKAWYSLELAASVGLFYLGIWIAALLPEVGPLKWFIAIALSLAAGVFLPSLLFGRPQLKLKWRIDGIDVDSGRPMVDLSRARVGGSEPEIAFTVDLTSKYTSFLGYLLLRSVIKKKLFVFIESTPPGIVAIKRQKSSPNATVHNDNGVESIKLGLTEPEHNLSHARFVGSFVPQLIGGGVDDLNLSARLFDSDKSTRSRAAGVVCGIVGVKVRS